MEQKMLLKYLALFTNEISKNYSDYASDNPCASDISRLVDTDITNGANAPEITCLIQK